MGFAVGNLGQSGYAIGFITFIFLTLFALSMAWILKYAREDVPEPAINVSIEEVPAVSEHR
jgi:hypothetical protein